jgi:hypothetical protein
MNNAYRCQHCHCRDEAVPPCSMPDLHNTHNFIVVLMCQRMQAWQTLHATAVKQTYQSQGTAHLKPRKGSAGRVEGQPPHLQGA